MLLRPETRPARDFVVPSAVSRAEEAPQSHYNAAGKPSMIEFLSLREEDELRRAKDEGQGWARVILDSFAAGARLRLGWDQARTEPEIGETREAIAEAARWCARHGLHLMAFEGEGPGEDPVGERRHFMAVG